MEYQKNSHCKFLIALHHILVVKYRKRLLDGTLGVVIKNALLELSQRSGFSIEQMEVDQDHIHILMTISPRYSVSQHVRRIKQHTTKTVWQTNDS